MAVRIVLVEFYVTESRVLLIKVAADGTEPVVAAAEVSREQLRAAADDLRRDHRGVAALLEDPRLVALMAPLADWTEPEDLVYLVPHDVLHVLPLHALPVAGRPLAERNPVAMAPSTSVLRYAHSRRRPRGDTALIVADPLARRPLSFAREQAHAIAASFRHCDVRTGADASREDLLRVLGGPRAVIHFTTHAVFEAAEPMRSGIELAGGRLTAGDFLQLSLDTDLVTLAACETGVSARHPGDELIGLTRALLYAGARSALVSLWPVDELSTSLMLAAFYTELSCGTSKAESLRRSQQQLRRTTLAAAIGYARTARARIAADPVAAATLAREEARLLFRAGDWTGADQVLEAAGRLPDLPASVQDDLRVARLRVNLAQGDPGARPDRLAFGDPYYWAPFVLVGDWK